MLKNTITFYNELFKPFQSEKFSFLRNITISNPISNRIGMETLSGRRSPTAMLTINLTFHSTSVATSQQTPASLWLRATSYHTSLNAFPPPFLTYTLFTPAKNQILSLEMIIILLITPLVGSNPLPATKHPKKWLWIKGDCIDWANSCQHLGGALPA